MHLIVVSVGLLRISCYRWPEREGVMRRTLSSWLGVSTSRDALAQEAPRPCMISIEKLRLCGQNFCAAQSSLAHIEDQYIFNQIY